MLTDEPRKEPWALASVEVGPAAITGYSLDLGTSDAADTIEGDQTSDHYSALVSAADSYWDGYCWCPSI